MVRGRVLPVKSVTVVTYRSMPEDRRTLATLDLIGGSPALDFANTINSRRAPVHDYLATFGDVLAWERKVGVFSEADIESLAHRAAADAAGADRELRAVHALREAIYRTFSARSGGTLPDDADLRIVLRAHAAAIVHGQVRLAADGAVALAWVPTELIDVMHPIAHAAGVLLLAVPSGRLGECPSCGWLFLDQTRSGNCRWCDMRTCGSRDKMRRYYRARVVSRRERG